MAMLCRVKMTSRCIRPKTAVETEIISAGSFLKGRTRCTVNSTIENHRQWRITRKDIAKFLET